MNAFPGVRDDAGLDRRRRDGLDSQRRRPGAADHLVVRVDPSPPAVVGGGFATGTLVYDVTCYWSLTGTRGARVLLAARDRHLEPDERRDLVPATFENGAWRPIPVVPTPGILPAGWSDG